MPSGWTPYGASFDPVTKQEKIDKINEELKREDNPSTQVTEETIAMLKDMLDKNVDEKSDDSKRKHYSLNLVDIPTGKLRELYNELRNSVQEPEKLDQAVRDRVANLAFVTSGAGPYFNQIQTYLTCLDRFGGDRMPVNTMTSGLTFITRPRLCLQSSNLRHNRRMAALDTLNPRSMAFMIRNLLDTNFGLANNRRYSSFVEASPLLDVHNPFLTPLCNSLTAISGFPDFSIETHTTEGGYQQEAQTFAIGADDFNRGTYSLNLNFKDIQHGPVSAILYYWMEYIRCVTRGIMTAYADDIDQQRLNYTVSIYRFALDPSRTYIVDWCKCTGCFPTSLNTGSILQVNNGEDFVRAATDLSVTFACNKVEYRDYAIFMDFNTLVRRYCPSINMTINNHEAEPDNYGRQSYYDEETKTYKPARLIHPNLPKIPVTNFRGIPYITSDMHGPRLEFRRASTPVFPYVQGEGDIVDELVYLDMMRTSKQVTADVYNRFAEAYIPEYFDEMYQHQDLSKNLLDFFNRVLKDKTLDSRGFSTTTHKFKSQQTTAGEFTGTGATGSR